MSGPLPPYVALAEVSAATLDLARRAAREAAEGPRQAANGMSEHAFRLAGPSAEAATRAVLYEVDGELSRVAEPLSEPQVHAFVVDYGPDADRSLDLHVDDAALTINLCLNTDAELVPHDGSHADGQREAPSSDRRHGELAPPIGCELELLGVRCRLHRHDPPRPEERYLHVPRPGQVILHHGDLRHRVWPLRSGRRRSLLWWIKPPEASREGVQPVRCHPQCGHRPG